jgi:hypothetical protein
MPLEKIPGRQPAADERESALLIDTSNWKPRAMVLGHHSSSAYVGCPSSVPPSVKNV